MDIDDHGWPTWICVGLLLAVLAAVALTTCGCAATHVDRLSATISAALAQIQEVRADVTGIQSDIAVGGGSDSVTAWLYAAIAGASVLYPLIWRPARRWIGRRHG